MAHKEDKVVSKKDQKKAANADKKGQKGQKGQEAVPEPEVKAKVEPKKPASGLRTAVRYGHKSAKQALEELDKIRQDGGFVRAELVAWLRRRN